MPGARAPPLFDSPLDSRLATGEIFAESEGWKFLANSRSGDRERERGGISVDGSFSRS